MSGLTRRLWLSCFLIVTLACQVTSRWLEPTPSLALMHTGKAFPAPASATPSPTTTVTLTPTFVPTGTPTPTFTPTPTLVPSPSALQLEVFEKLWHIVWEQYVYPDFNGLDWEAIGDEYRQRIKAGMTDRDFYAAMVAMIDSLGDDHSAFLPPEEAREWNTELSGENNYVGIGVMTNVVPERRLLVILLVFPDSPAEEAGLKPHDSIIAVDGEPVVDDDGFRRNLLAGPENTTIELTVQTPHQPQRQVSVTRRNVAGSVPVPYQVMTTPQGKRIGYLLLITLADETIDNQVKDALKDMSDDAPLDGLILDNRENGGGVDSIAREVLGYFTHGTLGYFYDRDRSRRSFYVPGADINGSSRLPLVVLVGPGTVSFGEITSGVLKDTGRAFLIGETTGGNVELLWGYDFADGSIAFIAHETFRPRYHSDQDWEVTGIIPDLVVPTQWDEVTVETDPAIHAALTYFDSSQ